MKFLTVFFAFTALLITPALAQSAPSVSGVFYRADATAPNGYKEAYRWRFNQSDEWRRFEHLVPQMKAADRNDVTPFTRKPPEFIVLSVKDPNGLTGKDYFLSRDGIMLTSILAKHTYYNDDKNFLEFLKEEVSHRNGFESFPGEKIALDAQGIVARYRINENLPNPSWLVNSQKDVNLYDGFMRKLVMMKQGAALKTEQRKEFEKTGQFVMVLNYPQSPASFATIGPLGIRFSEPYSEDVFFADEKNYYKFFYDKALENLKLSKDAHNKDKQKIEKGQF